MIKWNSGVPSPVLVRSPIPTALRDIPISPLSSSMFDSSIGAPSPAPSPPAPPATPRGLRSLPVPSSCHSDFYGCCSASSSSQPSTPTRPEGFFDWWFSEMSPVVLESTPVRPTPRFMENLSPLASSLFDSPEPVLEATPSAPSPSLIDSPVRRPMSSPSLSTTPTSPWSHTPSPVFQQRRRQSHLATPDFSPIRLATPSAFSSTPSERRLPLADLITHFAAMSSTPSPPFVRQTPP